MIATFDKNRHQVHQIHNYSSFLNDSMGLCVVCITLDAPTSTLFQAQMSPTPPRSTLNSELVTVVTPMISKILVLMEHASRLLWVW